MLDYEAARLVQKGKEVITDMKVRRSVSVYKNMKDPGFLKAYYKFKTLSLLDKAEIEGSSPPDIFIGRFGYPNVFIGPLIPPTFGDTSILSTPEDWVGKSIQDIVEYRSMLVRGMHRTKITNIESGRIENAIRDLALSDKFIYADAKLSRRPNLHASFDENSQPYGPSAPLKELEIGVGSTNKKIQDAYSDTDMLANTAIQELYKKGEKVSKIQKALSAGVLGLGKNRKFVPTRWSITAVDDTLSKTNLKLVKSFNYIDSVRVYYSSALDNRWVVLMAPQEWNYELVEAWYPGTLWNEDNNNISIFSSFELNGGRTKYAEIGGCYYAARLASSELLLKEQKQASVVVLREAHPGYIMPVGVWNVREHVRNTLKGEPLLFQNLSEAMNHIKTKFDIPLPIWIKNSTVLRYLFSQKKLYS